MKHVHSQARLTAPLRHLLYILVPSFREPELDWRLSVLSGSGAGPIIIPAGPIGISARPSASRVSGATFPTGIECVRRGWRDLRCYRLHGDCALVRQRSGCVTVEGRCSRPRRGWFMCAELLWRRSLVCGGGVRNGPSDLHLGSNERGGLDCLRRSVGGPCLHTSPVREGAGDREDGCDPCEHADVNRPSHSLASSHIHGGSLTSLALFPFDFPVRQKRFVEQP